MKELNPEILSPGGDFNSAVHALENGADAVYIGLKNFSARKSAKNFTTDEVRRLKSYCKDKNKMIYVAINTLLKDNEIDTILPLIKELEEIKVDAIIIQDLGLSSIISNNTSLPIHASTQLAVHNVHGVKALLELGFSRVVLSRELSSDEIKNLIQMFPEMEFEVFIHGALCYGFSGLCLASGKLLNRSANRGSCGQICRTWFTQNNKKEFSLSLNDLSLGSDILELKKAGVNSLKIEGRMKGPGYSSTTAKLYSNILNNINDTTISDNCKIEFNRDGHSGYFSSPCGGAKTNTTYPGHKGVEVGEIISKGTNNFLVKVTKKLNNRDGIMLFKNSIPVKEYKLPVEILKQKSNIYTLKGNIPQNYLPTLYKISSHDKHLKEISPKSYKPSKSIIKTNIELKKENIFLSVKDFTVNYDLPLETAKNRVDLNNIFHKIFYAGGDTPYNFECNITNSSGVDNPFIPASSLKKIRNIFQEEVCQFLDKQKLLVKEPTLNTTEIRPYIKNRDEIPFIIDFLNVNIDLLSKRNGFYLLPLSPVIFNSEKYLSELKTFLKNNNDSKFIIGLNNISHIAYLKELPEDLTYYCDYGLYNTNRFSIDLYKKNIPNLMWITKWVEEDNSDISPPLFISRTCLYAKKRGCPKECGKHYNLNMEQNGRSYNIVIRDCITYIFNG